MRTWCYIGCDTARGRRAKTPRGGEFSVVEQGALELHHLQHLGKHIHRSSRGTSCKLLRTPEQIIIRQLASEQESRTRGQAPHRPSVHSLETERQLEPLRLREPSGGWHADQEKGNADKLTDPMASIESGET